MLRRHAPDYSTSHLAQVSVTELIDRSGRFASFDGKRIIDQHYKFWQDPANRQHGKYGNMSQEEILALWDQVDAPFW